MYIHYKRVKLCLWRHTALLANRLLEIAWGSCVGFVLIQAPGVENVFITIFGAL